MDDEKLYQQFLNSFRLGLKKEAGNKYDLTNKDSNALGKYQFLPKYWWNNKPTKMDSIPDYARKKGYGELKSYDDFLNNPTLQEDYFEAYTKNQVYPKAKELYKSYGAKRGLRIDEIGALIHFQGEAGADTIVKTGKHKGATSINPSTQEDLRRYNDAIVSSGGKGVSNTYATAVLVDKNVAKKEFRDMNSKIDAIQKQSDLSQEVKNLKINDVKKEYYKKGYFDIDEKGQPTGIFNSFIAEINTKKDSELNVKKQKYGNLINYFNSALDIPQNKNTDERNNFSFSKVNELDLSPVGNKKGAEQGNLETILKEHPEFRKYAYYEDRIALSGGKTKKVKVNFDKEGNIIGGAEKLTGWASLKFKVPNSKSNEVLSEVDNGLKKLAGPNAGYVSLFDKNGKLADANFGIQDIVKDSTLGFDSSYYKSRYLLKTDWSKNNYKEPFLDVNPGWQQEVMQEQEALEPKPESAKPSVPPPSTSNPKDYTPQDIEGAKNQALAEGYNKSVAEVPVTPKEDDLSIYNDYWNLDAEKPETGTYDPSQYKDDFPFADVLTSGVSILQGNKMANTDVPMRDEQVSDSFRNFTSELAKLSQIGLRPEEEAYAKRMLTESYQSGVEQIVKASGGNRNIVLGNLGRLDYQKQKGLLDISVADAQMKNEALFKYGEAVKYINEFDANRDIANNERKYQDAMLTKQTGGQLMAAGFQSLMDNIQYYKENKPGSANHAYKSYMYRKMFGVDPTLKDNGKGDRPYTLSSKKKEDEEKLTKYYGNKATADKAMALSPEQKKIAQKVMIESGGNTEIANGVINYLFDSKSTGANVDLSKLSDAVKNKDFSLLFPSSPASKASTAENNNVNSVMNTNEVFGPQNEQKQPSLSTQPFIPYENKQPTTSFQDIFQTPATEPKNPNGESKETPAWIKEKTKEFFGEGALQYLESTKQ